MHNKKEPFEIKKDEKSSSQYYFYKIKFKENIRRIRYSN